MSEVSQTKAIYVGTENNGTDRFIIADFYNHQHRLIVKIDGSIHNLPEVIQLDNSKEELLTKQ